MSKFLLMSPEEFLKSGIHIGTKYKTKGMKKYIYNTRRDGLRVLSIETISDKIQEVAKLLSNYDPKEVVVVGKRVFASTAIKKFCEITGMVAKTGRFMPGTFTNSSTRYFMEPKIVLITESNLDKQAIKEAKILNLPVVAFSSTNNFTHDIDLVIPANNKGAKSLAILYWLLSREYLFVTGAIKTRKEFTYKVSEFEYKGKVRKKPQTNNNRHQNRRFSRRR